MKKILFVWVVLATAFMSYRPEPAEVAVDPNLCQAGAPLLAINATAFVAQPGPVFVRKNATTLTAAEVTAYRAGITAMRARPATNPRSWQYQSDMHGKMAGAILAGQDQCQHGSYLFLSWHRMYLYFFERILRASSGNPNFGLPYWGYNTASAVSRRVPPIYRSPAVGNSLFDGTRNPALNNNAAPASISAANASTTNAFSFTNFTSAPGSGLSFGGQRVPGALHFGSPHGALENTPHDVIHVNVGGNMLDPRTAALDPLFWAHHCQIDRLWDRWLNTGGGRANPTEANWLNRSFTFFNETGAAVVMTGRQVVATARQLNYRYDDTPPAVAMIPMNEALQTQTASFFDLSWLFDDDQQKPKPVAEKPVTSRIVAELGAKDVATPRTKLALADKSGGIAHCMAEMKRNKYLKTGETPTRVALYVDGLMYEKLPKGTYEVYVNMPDAANPNYENEYYVGNLGLFGLSKELTKGKGGAVALEITNVMMKLYDKNPNVKALDVTLYQRGLEGADGKPLAVSGKIKLSKVRIVTEKQ